jgi:hypothetical protein
MEVHNIEENLERRKGRERERGEPTAGQPKLLFELRTLNRDIQVS